MSTLYIQPPHLPSNFAQSLLDCQIQFQLNSKIPSQMLMKLLQLYRQGIEYYESIRSYKYVYFQRKMNAIVKSEKVLENIMETKLEAMEVVTKPEVVVVESLSDFRKEQISFGSGSSPLVTDDKSKKSTPFKRHLQQKFQSKTTSQSFTERQKLQRQKQQQKQKQTYQHKRLIELQHKEKHQQLTQTINSLQSDKVIRNFIAIEDRKLKEIQSKVGKVVQDQEEEFRKKLEERRERVKSNTEKRRMTKSFSERCEVWGGATGGQGSGQNQGGNRQNVENCEVKVGIDLKTKRTIPSTKLFASFTQEAKDNFNYDDFTFEQVPNPNVK